MRKYHILIFLIVTMLFNNKVGECSLWELDFEGYITEAGVTQHPGYPDPTTVEDLLGVSIGSKMKSLSIYNTDPYLFSSNEFLDHYYTSSLVLNFQTFTVSGGSDFYVFKDGGGLSFDILYGGGMSGFLRHEDGWWEYLEGYGLYFENKTGVSYTLESFPTVLNSDNFDIRFGFSGYIHDRNNTSPWSEVPTHVFGVVDKIKIHEVPEPSSLLLLGSGLVCLAGFGWRRSRI